MTKATSPPAQMHISAPQPAAGGGYRITAGSGGASVGSVILRRRDPNAIEILDLAVRSSERGYGYGRTLMASALRVAAGMGRSEVQLTSEDRGSGRLTQWYRDMGFMQIGRDPKGFPRLSAPIQRVLSNVSRPLPPRPSAAATHGGLIQRATQIPGFGGFYYGSLSSEQQKGGFQTVFSQPSGFGDTPVAHSSNPMTKTATKHLVDFAEISHVGDEENSHAEDKLTVVAHQWAASKYAKLDYPQSVNLAIPTFHVSASPCTSEGGTSAKTVGCTENLIAWHNKGILLSSEEGCPLVVKITIGKLTVNNLYKGNTKIGAAASYQALLRMIKEGAIQHFRIEKMPVLKEFDGVQEM